jgi:uncharacterized protein (DUF1800 family)
MLRRAAGTGAAAAALPLALPHVAAAQATEPLNTPGAPPPELIALNRMGYGPRPGDIARVRTMGLDAYIEEQLSPPAGDDAACAAKVAAVRLRIAHDGGGPVGPRNEAAPLGFLGSTPTELWDRRNFGMDWPWQERMRPWEEVRAAHITRAIHSRYQLREVLVDFWHNHFNVNASSDAAISVGFPEYDRIIRQHCLGRFRDFVEAIGRSAAMMYYLDNVSNQAGGGEGSNENYARELFELHTLGSGNYIKIDTSDPNFEGVGANADGHAKGYTDYDVYQAADCFSGWTISDGGSGRPPAGAFWYRNDWHDNGFKIVLSPTFRPNILPNGGENDGEIVYDRLCQHRGTARYICTKLVRRLVGDEPPAAVVDAAVAEWMAHVNSPDQIKRVVRVILQSAAFRTTWGQKVKRPLDAVISYVRALGVDMRQDDQHPTQGSYWGNLLWNLQQSGHRAFEWPTPTGYPDVAAHWCSTNGMLRRWNMVSFLTDVEQWGGGFGYDIVAQTNMSQSCTQIIDAWIARLFGYTISAATRQAAIDFLAQTAHGGSPTQAPRHIQGEWTGDTDAIPDRVIAAVRLLAMSPDFQMR